MDMLEFEPPATEEDKHRDKIAAIEAGLLGWIFSNNEILDHLGFLREEHFLLHENAQIYAQMLKMRNEGASVTPLTIEPHLKLGEMREYLQQTIRMSGGILRPLDEAKLLVSGASKRAITKVWQETMETAPTRTPEELVAALTDGLDKILRAGGQTKFFTDKQISQQIMERLNNPRKPYSTGLKKLDQAMDGGLYPGMNYLIAARKKVGKTTMASTISCNLNLDRVPHLFICAEMSAAEIQQRVVARMTESFTSSFRNEYGRSPHFQEKVRRHIEESAGCIIYQSAPGITFDELRRSVAQAISIHKIKGFILDSLQLVGGKSSKKSTAEHQDEVSQWCADYTRQKGIFSIVTAQINQTGGIRGGEGVRLACDQGYEIHAPEDDPSRSDRWVEMIETRYTRWMNIGSKDQTELLMHEYGQYFHQRDLAF